MITVIPITQTAVNWEVFLTTCQQLLSRSITRGQDAKGQKVGDLASFICTLGEFQDAQANPTQTLREAGSLLRFVTISFLVCCPENLLRQIAYECDLSILPMDTNTGMFVGIISGNLQEWRTSIINCSTNRTDSLLRKLFNQVFLAFEGYGLRELFSTYYKKGLPDQTFLLELK